MEIRRVLEILRPLAEGINPYTGEILSVGSPYQNADTVRALYTAINVLERKLSTEKRRANLPTNAGKPWSANEDKSLLSSFDSGRTISELAKVHERTSGAIQSRLIKLGKIQQYTSEIEDLGRHNK